MKTSPWAGFGRTGLVLDVFNYSTRTLSFPIKNVFSSLRSYNTLSTKLASAAGPEYRVLLSVH